MKNLLLSLLKYIFILLICFVSIFFLIAVFHLFPFFKINQNKDFFIQMMNGIIEPAFYHSIFNSIVLSLFIYGVIVLNYEKNNRFFLFFVPLILSAGIGFAVFFYMKPTEKDTVFYNIDDARIFLTEKAFIDYRTPPPGTISRDDFEKKVLAKVNIPKDREFIKNLYVFNYQKKQYDLKRSVFFNPEERLTEILYQIGYFEPIKLYFNRINGASIENLLMIHNQKVSTYEMIALKFTGDRILFSIPGIKPDFEFKKEILHEYNIYDSFLVEFLFKNFTFFTVKLISYKNLFIFLSIWFSICFLVLSFVIIITMKYYPFLTFIYKFAYLFLTYVVFSLLTDILNSGWINILPEKHSSLTGYILAGSIFAAGLLLQGMRVLFFKTNTWEK